MLAEQGIDIERGADVLGRIDGADLDMGALVGGEHLLQIVAGDRIGLAAGDRIAVMPRLKLISLPVGRSSSPSPRKSISAVTMPASASVTLSVADVGEQPAAAGARS